MRVSMIALLSAMALGGVSPVLAADFDDGILRGSEYDAPGLDWSGFYIAGHGGYTTGSVDYDRAGRTDLARLLANTTVETEYSVSTLNQLKSQRAHSVSFGGLAGYNFQYDDVVIGFELDYTSVFQKTRSGDSMGRSMALSDGSVATVLLKSDSVANLKDYSTLRLRAGYAFGSFLPFVTAGLAVGRADVGTMVSVNVHQYADSTYTREIGSLARFDGSVKEKYAFGFAAGAGLDYAVTQNVFVRGEYQYVQFGEFGDHRIHANTARAVVGVKF